MAYYYVKNGGTASGDGGRYATQKSGSFATIGAAGYYNSIGNACSATTAPAAGDIICVSDQSDNSNVLTTNITYFLDGVLIISVDDTACDTQKPGAQEGSSSYDMRFDGNCKTVGVDLYIGDDLQISGSTYVCVQDGSITLTGAADLIDIIGDGGSIELINTDVVFGSNSSGIRIRYAGSFYMYGGSLVDGGSGIGTLTYSSSGWDGGCTYYFDGVDMSAKSTGYLVDGIGDAIQEDRMDVIFANCLVGSSVDLVDVTMRLPYNHIIATNCYTASGATGWRHYEFTDTGTIRDQETIYRNETIEFPDGTKVALQCTTNAVCNLARPCVIDCMKAFAALSSVSSNVIRIYFASTEILTDKDIYAYVMYDDNTAGNARNTLSNQGNIIGAGTEWTDDSAGSAWKNGASDLSGYNEYYMDIDTSASPGGDCIPSIIIYITKPSAIVYIDPAFDVVA